MNTGQIISAAGHGILILWVLVGGFFSTPDDAPPVAVTSVSLMSTQEYEQLAAAAVGKPEAAPEMVEPTPPQPELDPAKSPRPEAKPQPATPPDPKPQPVAENNPDVSEIAPLPVPEQIEAPEPLAPVAEVEQPLEVPNTEEAKPQDAPRVAPVPAEAPPPDAEVADIATPSVSPDAAPDAPVVEEEQPAAAPEAATTQIITEAVETDAKPELAPTASLRPRSKPQAPARTAEAPVETAEPDAEAQPAQDSIADAVAAAVADVATEEGPTGTGGTQANAGPPLTAGEEDALRVAVQKCWNVGSMSSEALNTTVVISVALSQSGVPDAAAISMIEFRGGSDTAARQAYEAARRAVIRCGATGFKLPPEKYDQWKVVELEFNPEKMRQR
ncbi:MAG: cell envelope biogenesis protein TolA [Cereibacter sphaeroides]|uniref:Cell envelope biogenesis protein TolA n=1 Tax=Cereibacter sphaeroides TaxID=1063 RepID=A0A2W5SFC1_CERSP|nr:MAG: cell envelope biogenesis protein TolA [Cereibacter sphaeroides]